LAVNDPHERDFNPELPVNIPDPRFNPKKPIYDPESDDFDDTKPVNVP